MCSPSTAFIVCSSHSKICVFFSDGEESARPKLITVPADLVDQIIVSPSLCVYHADARSKGLKNVYVLDGRIHLCYATFNTQAGSSHMEFLSISASDIAKVPRDLTDDGAYTSCSYRIRANIHWFAWDDGGKMDLSFWPSLATCYKFRFSLPTLDIALKHWNESGRLLLCGYKYLGAHYFPLYRLHDDPYQPTCTRHHLSIPLEFVRDITEPYRVLIDDHLGIVYVSSETTISALCYA